MKVTTLISSILVALLAAGCGSDSNGDGPPNGSNTGGTDATGGSNTGGTDATSGSDSTGTGTTTTDQRTLATCVQSYEDGVPGFYSTYFACVEVSADGDGTVVTTDNLPPHPSAYYTADDPNYVAFDTRGGTHSKNPNELTESTYSMTVPANPIAKGIAIDASNVDNTMNTSDDEYSGGPVGITLNGIVIFAAMASPGDDLAEEQYTFDLYEGHPAGTTYHYHFETRGPLEVLVDRELSDDAEPGAGSMELYGIMCDGTLVFGCTELDGSAPDDSDFDAQNGHIHDITDGSTTHFTSRYHTHVCPDVWSAYPFFPEIAYYETSACPQQGAPGGGPPN